MTFSFTTPDLCDQYPDQVAVLDPILTNYGGIRQFSGEVVTVKCFEDNSMVKHLVGTPGQGRVLVVDGGGSLRRALLGDMLAEAAAEQRWAGLIIYGCIRDVDAIAMTQVGVQALNTCPVRTEKRGLGDIDVPVTFAGVTVNPGNFAYADNNGVIFSESSLGS